MTDRARTSWSVGAGDAEAMLAEARKALFVMVGFIAILWIVQLINVAGHNDLITRFGIQARHVGSLPNILSAPFVHLSWTHLEGNSGPLFIFGFLAAYRGVLRFLGLTLLVIVGSGMAAWLFAPTNVVGVGASGVVFGYLGYILVKGVFDRHIIDLIIGAVMALCFAYQFTVLLPHAGIGWQDHIGGLVSGVLGGWIFRDRSRARARAKSSAKSAAGQPAAESTGTAVAVPAADLPSEPAKRASGSFAGPRADLHKELDDLGI